MTELFTRWGLNFILASTITEEAYPWLIQSDDQVIDYAEPPVYQLFVESSAHVGVGATAVKKGICFDLGTFVFDTEWSDVLRSLVDDGVASLIGNVDGLVADFQSSWHASFDRERLFKSD